ncbi:MAG: hypothetical protein HY326_09285 [Chloroflexi bacterium]|nr:hypothetical protein [Chloroflexota bacterium]
MLVRLITPILKVILALLEKAFALTREKSNPPFPYDQSTKTITLPKTQEKEILRLAATGKKAEAVKKVTKLTGAGLRVSKDYVDNLVSTRER